ncbi:MAG: hypothetical protein GF313_00450 [Caldithrix sp.]|nr:hypothetical protein [Caldithrix sp.]
MFIRLLPVILSALLIAAHLMRYYGLEIALIPIVLLITLFIRHPLIRRGWQILMLISTIIWIDTTVELIHFRLVAQQPYLRLAVIMIAVILFTIFSGVMLENKRIQTFYARQTD